MHVLVHQDIKFSSTIFAILYYLTFASANVFKKRATYILLEDKIGWPKYILEAVFLVPKSRVDYKGGQIMTFF